MRQRISGKALQDAAATVAQSKGYLCAHFNPGQVRNGVFVTPFSYQSRGFPDLLLVGRKTVAVEVKGDGDSLSEDQRRWLEAFTHAGVETLVLTPKTWADGALEALLDG